MKETKGRGKRRPSELDIVIMSGVGRVRKFRVATWVLWTAALFLALYLVGSILVINGYVRLIQKGDEVARELDRLRAGEKELKKKLFKSEQTISFLRDYIASLSKEKKNSSKGKKVARQPLAKVGPRAKEKAPPPKRTETAQEQQAAQKKQALAKGSPTPPSGGTQPEKVPLEIRKFQASLARDHIEVSFRLYRLKKGTKPAEGYVHLVAINHKHDPPYLGNWPKVKLVDGRPEPYHRGEPFVIKRSYRTFKGKIPLSGKENMPTHIKVLVYDKDGNTLLEKGIAFSVKDKTIKSGTGSTSRTSQKPETQAIPPP